MSVTLRQPLTLEECQLVREWRNDPKVLPMLRTGYKTEEEQVRFYLDVICGPESEHRYYAIEDEHLFVGMGGLTYLGRVPGEGEISLIVGPMFRSKGIGEQAVRGLVDEGFSALSLSRVIGQCYAANPAREWWASVVGRVYPGGDMRYDENGDLWFWWDRTWR